MTRQRSLGKYQLLKRIAVGGMSEIYLASQGGLEGFERAVVVKCIRDDLDADAEVKEMFLDEARIAACLKHPNIVHLYDVGKAGSVAYLAMEYIFGQNLAAIAARARAAGKPLPLPFVLKVLCDSLAGLHYAHAVAEFEDRTLNMIHRDISPQNILVSFDGVTKIVDFGIAKAEARLSKTRAGVLKGKYAYMSPEQVRGKPLDHRADQFSLAVVFYEILTGTRLFLRETDYSTMEAVDACEVPPIRALRKDIPRRLARVLNRAMRKNPRRRFASCRDMERKVFRLLGGSPLEQTERVAHFLRALYGKELAQREQALAEVQDEQERDTILHTGFELLSNLKTQIHRLPDPPLARDLFQRLQDERRGTPPAPDAASRDGKHASRTPVLGKGLYDWRMLLVVFLAALVGAFFLLTRAREPAPPTPAGPPDLGEMKALTRPARAGVDGFLTVPVSAQVRIEVDGEDLGPGPITRAPLKGGIHRVILTHSQTRAREIFSISVAPDQERVVRSDRFP